MSPEAQRIAIARACGWTKCEGDSGFITRYIGTPSEVSVRVFLPDYLNDLNAMHEAEKVLTPLQSERYAEFILDVLEIPSPFIGTARVAYLTGHATASQRAEAFLRTFNLWTKVSP